MNIQMRYYTDQTPWLCFKHAVQLAAKGEGIHTEIVDKYQYQPILMYDGLTIEQTTCPYCAEEENTCCELHVDEVDEKERNTFYDHYVDALNRIYEEKEDNDD